MDNITKTVEYLESLKLGFMEGSDFSFQKSIGVDEVEDLLDGISQDGHDCYVSFLFNQLNEEEKEEVQRRVDFTIDFNGLAAYYSID
jgi:hypothetical protein